MKSYHLLLGLLPLLPACKKHVPEPDSVSVRMQFHNALHSEVRLELPSPGQYRAIAPGTFLETEGGDWFVYREQYQDASVFRLLFADGTAKVDTKCTFFQSQPVYYATCLDDSVSVYRRACYTVEVTGNDTLYRYTISAADSLEAH